MDLTNSFWFQMVATLATITGFGIALDRIFITEHTRERIEGYLTTPRSNRTWFEGYKEILGLSESIVFDRYFSGATISWGFLRSSFFVSTLSFIVAITIQNLFFRDFLPHFVFTKLQIATIGSFFLFNIAMDVITIAQTRAFIRASVSSDRPFNSIIFFGSDVIVTLNIFILTYAAFLLVLVQFFTIPEQSANVRMTADTWVGVEGEIYVNDDIIEGLIETQVSYSLSADEVSAEGRFDTLSTDPVSPIEAVNLLQLLYGGSLAIADIDPYFTEDVEGILGSELRVRLLRAADRSIALADPEAFPDYDPDGENILPRLAIDLRLDLAGVKPNISNIGALYTPAFITVDALEDNFPFAMFNSTGWVSMEDFISRYTRSQLAGSSMAAVLCETDAGYDFRFQADDTIDEVTRETLDVECQQSYIVRSRDWISNRQTVTSFGRGVDIYLPFSAMFITSMLPTMLLYLVMIGVATSASIHRVLVGRMARYGDFIVQQPIGFFCFLSGLAVVASLMVA
ncbi:hypothetical protein [Epibacterium sp. Ofav1-8]|uniref:hypothetical protein n=1 Tax=Epibacterium sp. Ofav1-8 TaxID=2917735 RepID=UPI001EF5C118|nr:hypothetical protein [Epibacterium sp. Ofav1-8]MCG7624974.1 hypothetical protein [Epibacterium sp. Ofav1-8]